MGNPLHFFWEKMSIALGSDGEPLIDDDLGLLEDEFLMGVHLGISCDVCGIQNIAGPRYHCRECIDFEFDLCWTCHQSCCSIHPCHGFDLIDAPLVPIRQSDLRHDPAPWTRFTTDDLHEFSELLGISLGVDDVLVTEWPNLRRDHCITVLTGLSKPRATFVKVIALFG